jgi:hypothetical protein
MVCNVPRYYYTNDPDGSTFRYAMERTNTFVKVWYWPRTSKLIPLDVYLGSPIIDTTLWVCGHSHFRDLTILIFVLTGHSVCVLPHYFDLRFGGRVWRKQHHHQPHALSVCRLAPSVTQTHVNSTGGDWAGAVFASNGCGANCTGKITN